MPAHRVEDKQASERTTSEEQSPSSPPHHRTRSGSWTDRTSSLRRPTGN